MSDAWAGVSMEGRSALVTGAGAPNGIGFATARLLASRGARVALAATTDRVHQRAEEIGGDSIGLVGDLRNEEQAAALLAEASSTLGTIGVLVNNAGMVQQGEEMEEPPFLQMSGRHWDEEIDRSLNITARMCRLAAPAMASAGWGRIVNVSSVTGPFAAFEGAAAYAAAKAGVDGLTRALALELGPAGVTVNSVAPGWIESGSQTPHEASAGLNTPAGRSGTPQEVAETIAFLCGTGAAYLSGQSIVVDGGNLVQEMKGA